MPDAVGGQLITPDIYRAPRRQRRDVGVGLAQPDGWIHAGTENVISCFDILTHRLGRCQRNAIHVRWRHP